MVSELLDLAVVFAVIAGMTASVLSFLAWYVFQQTPVRYVLAALTAFAVLGTAYHTLLILAEEHVLRLGPGAPSIQVVRTLMYTAVAALVFVTVYFNRTARGNLG